MKKSSETCVKQEEVGRFIIYFLNNDEGQSVHVEEAEEIDLSVVIQHVNLGGSVFMTQRRKPEAKQEFKIEKRSRKGSKILGRLQGSCPRLKTKHAVNSSKP